jgi:hypothetical protein
VKTNATLVGVVVLVVVLLAIGVARAQTYLTFSRPDQARFRLVVEEGVAQPDRRQFVPGIKVWTIADNATGQSYELFITSSTSAVGPVNCPQ